MRRVALHLLPVLLVLISPCVTVVADSTSSGDRITMKDGSVLLGTIAGEDDESITIDTESMGRLVLRKDAVDHVYRAERPFDYEGAKKDPDYNTILLVPTPETLPAGSGYFRDFELLFLNFGVAVTDAFNLSLATLFPISSELIMFGAGGKLRLVSREDFPLGIAAVGNVTHLEDRNFGSAGGVVGVGNARHSLNFSAQATFSDRESDSNWMLLVGGDAQVGERSKFVLEYATNTEFIDDDEEFDGIINIGMRFFGDDMSFTLTGFRPLGTDNDGLGLFPLGMFSMHW